MTTTDQWNPGQYNRFRGERMQPFYDLLALIEPRPGIRVIDLGCGTGEQAALLAERLPDATVEGIDSSPAMLEQAASRAGERVRFRQADIASLTDYGDYDLVFSNAALQWVPDNEALMARILGSLKPGGQVAVQVPRNEEHPSHRIPAELAAEPRFSKLLGGYVRESEVLALERYSTLLHEHGLTRQVCIEKIYGHVLARTEDAIEWVKGTSLAAYLSRLDNAGQAAFVGAFRDRLVAEVGDHSPYFYPFRRMLFWGVKS